MKHFFFSLLLFGTISTLLAQPSGSCLPCSKVDFLVTDHSARATKLLRYGDGYVLLSNEEGPKGWQGSLTVLDRSFKPKWSKKVSELLFLYDLAITDAGDFLLVGRTPLRNPRRYGFLNNKSVILKIAATGALKWMRKYDLGQRENLTRIYRHPNPPNPAYPYYLRGVVNSSSYPSTYDYPILVNLNDDGEVNFAKLYDFKKSDGRKSRDTEISNLAFGKDGQIIVTGSSNYRYTHSFLATIDAKTGTPLTAKQWSIPSFRSKVFAVTEGLFLVTTSETPQERQPFQLALVNDELEVLDQYFINDRSIQQVIDLIPEKKNQYRLTVVDKSGHYLNLLLSIKGNKLSLEKSGRLQLSEHPLKFPTILIGDKKQGNLIASGITDQAGILMAPLPSFTSTCLSTVPLTSYQHLVTLNKATLLANPTVLPTPELGGNFQDKEITVDKACDHPYPSPATVMEDAPLEVEAQDYFVAAPPPPPPPPPPAMKTLLKIPTNTTGVKVSVQSNGSRDELLLERGGAKGELQFRLSNSSNRVISITSMNAAQGQKSIGLRSSASELWLRITSSRGEETVKFKRTYRIIKD